MLKIISKNFTSVKQSCSKAKKCFLDRIRSFFVPIWKKFSKKFPRLSKILKNQTLWKTISLIFSAIIIFYAGKFSAEFVFKKQFTETEAVNFIQENPEIVSYSTFIMMLLMLLFFGVFGKAIWSVGAFYSFIIIVMFINSEKIASRNTPFLPEDLMMASEAGSLSDMVNWGNLTLALGNVALILFVCFILTRFTKKIPRYKPSRKLKYLFQVTIIVFSVASLIHHTNYLRTQLSGKGTTVEVDWLKAKIDFTNSKFNYDSNGYIVSTISALQANVINKPENYSKETINKIVEKYSKLADSSNKNKKSISDEKINIVYIMSESFVDPEKIKSVYNYGEKDPIPYTHQCLYAP